MTFDYIDYMACRCDLFYSYSLFVKCLGIGFIILALGYAFYLFSVPFTKITLSDNETARARLKHGGGK